MFIGFCPLLYQRWGGGGGESQQLKGFSEIPFINNKIETPNFA